MPATSAALSEVFAYGAWGGGGGRYSQRVTTRIQKGYLFGAHYRLIIIILYSLRIGSFLGWWQLRGFVFVAGS